MAIAVARAAAAHDKVARETVDDTIEERVRATMWQPVYSDVHAI